MKNTLQCLALSLQIFKRALCASCIKGRPRDVLQSGIGLPLGAFVLTIGYSKALQRLPKCSIAWNKNRWFHTISKNEANMEDHGRQKSTSAWSRIMVHTAKHKAVVRLQNGFVQARQQTQQVQRQPSSCACKRDNLRFKQLCPNDKNHVNRKFVELVFNLHALLQTYETQKHFTLESQ